jgi:hypothetical protein
MLFGLFCIIANIFSPVIVHTAPILDGILSIVGYFGLLLIFAGFFIQVLAE